MILTSTTTLTGNGLGRLTDAITAVVTHEVNGEYELRMTYPVTGIHYSDLAENMIIWARPDNVTGRQAFRIYRITRPLNNVVTVYARHIAYDMSGIIVEPYTATSLTNALTDLPAACIPSCPFTFTTTRSVASPFKVSAPSTLWQLLGGQAGSFLDVYGGEWDFNNFTADFKTHLGQNRGVSIRYGKNLTGLSQDVSVEATYMAVYPFWYDAETDTLVKLPEGFISVPGAVGDRIKLLDCTADFEEQPTEAQLRSRANTHISNNDIGQPQISWKVSFASLAQAGEYETQALLEEVELGDTLSVYYEPMNLVATSRVVQIQYDVLLGRYESVTLGRVKQNLAKIVAGTDGQIKQAITAARTSMDRAIDSATDFIVHGGGYMRAIFDENKDWQEIVSLDDPDIGAALKVWRWNNGGFGFSSSGYNGPYAVAITQDGQIVADFITTGTMVADIIKAGVLSDMMGSFRLDLTTGEFTSTVTDALQAQMDGLPATWRSEIQQSANQVNIRIDQTNSDLEGTQKDLDDFANEVHARFTFASDGLKIQGTEDSQDGSYVRLAADRQEFHVVENGNDVTALELSSAGVEAAAVNARGSVSAESVAVRPYRWYIDDNGLLTLGKE